jgi:hypothetical protein
MKADEEILKDLVECPEDYQDILKLIQWSKKLNGLWKGNRLIIGDLSISLRKYGEFVCIKNKKDTKIYNLVLLGIFNEGGGLYYFPHDKGKLAWIKKTGEYSFIVMKKFQGEDILPTLRKIENWGA